MILEKLEAELATLKLDQAQQTNPWELISRPTVLEDPIGIGPKLTILISIFVSFIIGSCIAIIKESSSGIIYELSDLKCRLKLLIKVPFLIVS